MRTASLLVLVGGSLFVVYACGGDSTTGSTIDHDADADVDANEPVTDASGSCESSSQEDGAVTDAQTDGGTDAGIASDIPDDVALFDETPGANTYASGLNAANWTTSGTFIAANAGTQWFGSANGNATGFFPNLSLKKNLGGVVANQPYTVSFYVSKHVANLTGVGLSHFSKLRIGGLAGTVNWTSTPSATTKGVWVQWVGTYTPASADVGGPFYFEATFDLPGMHDASFDGPIRAVR